ncbi:MAG: hypothetical protein KA059_02750 [Elusimicrobiales bacterium]|nr:hypothetical protein [Elusimicrobiales bacterium]
MEKKEIEKLIHTVKSKSSAIKEAADMFYELDNKERNEVVLLMRKSAQNLMDAIQKLLEEIKK